MSKESFVQRMRSMTDEELDNELLSQDINDTGRMIILNEMSMRNSRSIVKRVPWYIGLSVIISIFALGIAIISNWPELKSWFTQ